MDADASLEYGILGGSTVDSTASLTGNYGTLELDTSTGEYTYVHPDSSSIEALNAGQSVSDEFRISVSDSMALDSTKYEVLITGASENLSPTQTFSKSLLLLLLQLLLQLQIRILNQLKLSTTNQRWIH